MRRWLALGAVLGASLLLNGCCLFRKVIRAPKVERVRPRVTAIDFSGVDLAFEVRLRSRCGVPLAAPPVRYALDVQGRELIAGETDAGVCLPAHAEATVTLPARIAYRDVWRAYQGLKDVGEGEYRLRGEFLFSAMGRTVPLRIAREGKFPVLRRPRFSNLSLAVARSGLTGAQLTVEADVHNPNVFAIDMQDLGYAFHLGGRQVASLMLGTLPPIPADGTGHAKFTGRVSGLSAMRALLDRDGGLAPALVPSGRLKTRYGTAKLPPKGPQPDPDAEDP